MSALRRLGPALALLVALGGYYLPWLTNRAAVLSANAFDLAEWVGLSPAQRYADAPMLAPFFLRLVLVLLAWLFGLRAGASRGILRYALAVLALILALTFFPPLDFFRGAGNDVNYRQLMALCLLALAGLGLMVLFGRRRLSWRRVEMALAALAVFSAAMGHIMAVQVIRNLQIPAPTGIGFVVTAGALLVAMALLARVGQLPSTRR
ncbi:MAG: hypothetical protein IT323_15880 [Anaerolineae bacterium]|nr:hypothetical protein [Anaerolineae bacterium]